MRHFPAIVYLLFGIYIVLLAVDELAEQAELAKRGVATQGILQSAVIHKHVFWNHYKLIVNHQGRDDALSVSREVFEHYQTRANGQTVALRYLPDKPNAIILPEMAGKYFYGVYSPASAVIAGLLFVLAGFLAVYRRRKAIEI